MESSIVQHRGNRALEHNRALSEQWSSAKIENAETL